ncbi:MAG: COX15/CtaA family protein [Bacteroidetes bacterium]|nr:COX15/CtaA family protein [Bacteroidota bacterium]
MQTNERSSKLIATWLLIGVGMTVVQIALGGITRLTGSGLSITQWDVVTGSLPPLNEQQWLVEYNKYRLTPQFQLLNFNFSISDFKMIFFWEWFHRLWARTIGLVFIVGFAFLLVKKHFKKEMIKPLLLLFVLGGLQGAIGWIMVKSGLTGDAVYVQPTKLALHFIFAMGLLCYTYWFALSLLVKPSEIIVNASIRKWNITLILLIGFQLIYGALMAGHKAANVAATWPSINGRWIPEPFLTKESFLLNTINNKLFIHFVHRGLAYLLLLIIVLFTIQLFKKTGTALFYILRPLPIAIVFVQVMLGILTVLSSVKIVPGTWGVFEWMAQLHQLFGMLLLLSLVSLLFVVRSPKIS